MMLWLEETSNLLFIVLGNFKICTCNLVMLTQRILQQHIGLSVLFIGIHYVCIALVNERSIGFAPFAIITIILVIRIKNNNNNNNNDNNNNNNNNNNYNFQRISILIQRFNEVAFRGTFDAETGHDE